jgi:hypothetical protein
MKKRKEKREKRKKPDETSLEEKLALLSETEKAYVLGFIDRAIAEEVKREKCREKSEE